MPGRPIADWVCLKGIIYLSGGYMKQLIHMLRRFFCDNIPTENMPEFTRFRVVYNAHILLVGASVLTLTETLLYFFQQKYYGTGWQLQIFLFINVAFLAEFYYIYKERERVKIRSTLALQALYELMLMIFAACLVLRVQTVFDLVHVYVMMIVFVVLFLNQTYWVHVLLTYFSYAFFVLMLPFYQTNALFALTAAINTFIGCSIALLFSRILSAKREKSFLGGVELRRKNEELSALAQTDMMTGMLNHTSVLGRLEGEMLLAQENGKPLCIFLADIDRFKVVNDRHGHLVGDHVICNVAIILMNCLRESDFAGRYGGEEFLIVLPDTDLGEASAIAERMRMQIDATALIPDGKVTISGGIAVYREESLGNLISAADKRLYIAKNRGGNCILAED